MPTLRFPSRQTLLLAVLAVIIGIGLLTASAPSTSLATPQPSPSPTEIGNSSAEANRREEAASGPASSTSSSLPERSQWHSQFPYPQVAEAVRKGNYSEAKTLLLPRMKSDPNALLVLGLVAHHFEETQDAEHFLQQADGRNGDLEDWRLFALADSAMSNGHLSLARIAQERLLADHPYSNLRQEALLRVAQLAYEEGNTERAFELVDAYRNQGFSREHLLALEELAWKMAQEDAWADRRRESARRFLFLFPLEASEKKAVELFRETSGKVTWTSFLSPGELVTRAQALMAVDLIDSALEALNKVGTQERDLSWHITSAEALLRKQKGVQALAQLSGLTPDDPRQLLEVNWLRAKASLEAARIRKSRQNLDSTTREKHRNQAVSLLRTLATNGLDPKRSEEALELVFEQVSSDEDQGFEASLDILRQLRALSPRNSSGALYIWKKGWREYKRRNFTGAIGYWSELRDLYPESSYSRSGQYWTGRAYRLLGDEANAETALREVAMNPSLDFYRRYALAHLDPDPVAIVPTRQQPWPIDLRLHRASQLSALGLDDTALTELDALKDRVDESAYNALRGTILGRLGDRRQGITHFYRAFRSLGTPRQHEVPRDAWRGYYPIDHADLVREKAEKQGLSSSIVLGIIRQESAFDTRATSYAGARGLMQVMPATGKELARKLRLSYSTEKLYDPRFSVELGTHYFRQVLDMFDGQVEIALAGYNSGPYRMKRLWREAGPEAEMDFFIEDLYSETPKIYVKRILLFADSYEKLYPGTG